MGTNNESDLSENENPTPEPDLRAEFVIECICGSFRANSSKIIKEDFKLELLKFFERREFSIIVITLVPGAAAPSIQFEWPQKYKSKGIYFMKLEANSIVPKEEFLSYIKYGEISISPLGHLSNCTENVSMHVFKEIPKFFDTEAKRNSVKYSELHGVHSHFPVKGIRAAFHDLVMDLGEAGVIMHGHSKPPIHIQESWKDFQFFMYLGKDLSLHDSLGKIT